MNVKYTACVLLMCGFLRTILATSIRDEVDSVIKRMDQMEQENTLRRMDGEQQHLKSRIHALEEENKEQRVLDRQLLTENKELRDVIEKQESRYLNFMSNGTVPVANKRRRSFPEVPCAFTAVLDRDIRHAVANQTIIFNRILLNDGNAYNINTGVLTVPTGGVYLFYLAFASGYEPQQLWMHIVVNGVGKVAGVADNFMLNRDAQGTNLALLRLHRGDSVWVSTFCYSDVRVYGYSGFTSFSGILLYRD